MAASMAFPPFAIIEAAAFEAIGWTVAATSCPVAVRLGLAELAVLSAYRLLAEIAIADKAAV
jgi:hypothetical protein